MFAFDDFVAVLGTDALDYTPAELKQLHVDVLTFASLLLDVHEHCKEQSTPGHPQARLDDRTGDRTLETKQSW